LHCKGPDDTEIRDATALSPKLISLPTETRRERFGTKSFSQV
jgi:hypothetical protein